MKKKSRSLKEDLEADRRNTREKERKQDEDDEEYYPSNESEEEDDSDEEFNVPLSTVQQNIAKADREQRKEDGEPIRLKKKKNQIPRPQTKIQKRAIKSPVDRDGKSTRTTNGADLSSVPESDVGKRTSQGKLGKKFQRRRYSSLVECAARD